MRMKKIIALIGSISISSLGLLLPMNIAKAAEFCEGGQCEVIFNKTEQFETWQVPSGVSEIQFEVYGAQGGANGGLGGFVSGTLTNLPAELTIVVGGEGSRGSNLDGGYNGGGFSGGRDGNPGSGGGASDIRFGSELADRVVVAGGGGGFGGPVGGSGGAGGGEIASDGAAGQGGAGAGGNQLSGGAGGRSNSGNTNGASGRLGVGGEGGYTFSGYGGGGGGAGYYGGGGGGADTDTCCLDAGGGGGGSSFADSNVTSNVTFQPGYQAGDGKIVLRYSIPATITDFSYIQTSPTEASVSLAFDSAVTGVEVADFTVTGCADTTLSGADASYNLALTGCEANASVLIPAGSFGAGSNTPTTERALPLSLDQTPPDVSFQHPETVSSDGFQIVVTTDATAVIDETAISSIDCVVSSVAEANELMVTTSGCPEGNVAVNFESGFLTDSIGNSSLTQSRSIQVLVDTISPTVSAGENEINEVEIEGQRAIRTLSPVSFSESVLTFDDFVFNGSDQCLPSHTLGDGVINLITELCPSGEISWFLAAGSLVDSAGNSAPVTDLVIALQIPALESPEPAPAPEVVQPPVVQPAPGPVFIPTPEPEPEPAPDPEPEAQPEPELDQEPEVPADPAVDSLVETDPEPQPEPVQPSEPSEENDAGQTDTDAQSVPAPETAETEQSTQPEVEKERIQNNTEPEIEKSTATETSAEQVESDQVDLNQALPVAQVERQRESADQDVNPWAVVLAALIVLGLLTGVVYLTKNNRSRAIE